MKSNRYSTASSSIREVGISFLEYVLSFTILIECNSLFHYSENYRQTTLEIVTTAIAIMLEGFLLLVDCRRYKAEYLAAAKKGWLVDVTLIFAVLVFLILNVTRIGAENSLRKYCLSFVLFLPLTCLLFRKYRIIGKPYELLFKYSQLVIIIAICNLVVFFAVTLRPEIVRALMLKSRWSGQGYLKEFFNYLNLCCTNQSATRTIAGFSFFQNMCFFPEPLMYCIPLITTLFTEMFLRRRAERRPWKWIVLIAAVITSQSTLGMLLALGAIGIKLIETAQRKRSLAFVVLTLFFVACAACALLWQKSNVNGNSTAAHLEHYVAAFRTFLQYPLIGCGYLQEEPILRHVSPSILLLSKGLSNSIAVVLAEGGIILELLCLTPFLLCLAQIKSENSGQIALWVLGPLGLYCVTVFHFHLLLMAFMAFGYSMLEFAPSEGGKRKLVLSDDPQVPRTPEMSSHHRRIVNIVGSILGCGTALVLFLSGNLWKSITRWMRIHQLFLGQSAWKVFFFSLFVILAVLVIKNTLSAWSKKEDQRLIAELMWFIFFSAVYAVIYPAIFSLVGTVLDIATPFGDLFETTALAVLYFGSVAMGWILISLLRRSKHLFVAGIIVIAVFSAGAVGLTNKCFSRMGVDADSIAPVVRDISEAGGKIYANEHQAVMKRVLPELTFSPARDGAFAAMENASVIVLHDRNLRDLFAEGFEVTELSPKYILYSNDPAVIDRLRSKGYVFSKYYPFPQTPDNDAAVILSSGSYTLRVDLRKSPEPNPGHRQVCAVQITSYYGQQLMKERLVYADEFDANGVCTVFLPFSSGNREGMEYLVVPEESASIQVDSISLTETPDYITETTYNGRYQIIRETYYDISGKPYYQSQGYAAMRKEYDRAGRMIYQEYLDGNGQPVFTTLGYASLLRTYNLQGHLSREAYFNEDGNPCLIRNGYASVEREYDRKGNVIAVRYLGETDQPVMTSWGYAEISNAYNNKRQLLEQRFYDAAGEGILLPAGYWVEKREYDDAGNVSVQRYFDTNERPVLTDMGYAGIRKEYDKNGKVVFEEYYGVDGERIALRNGAASQQIEYGPDGKVSARHYYNLNGAEIMPEA